MHYKLASIILSSVNKNSTSTEVFISQPDANKEALAGRLFVLAEVESEKVDALKIINFLINNINHNYYQNEKIILRERISTLKVEHIFETSLSKTNNELNDFIEKERIKIKPSLLNITIGVIYENDIHFSSIGKNKAFLIYKKIEPANKNIRSKAPTQEIIAEYKISDILEVQKESGQSQKITYNKLFSNVVSGAIPEGGYFLFSNETLPEYLSNRQIIDIITKLPPSSAAEQIKNTLSKVNAYVSFLGMIIKNNSGQKPILENENIQAENIRGAQNSIARLKETETKTEEYLTPPGMIDIKKWLAWPLGWLSKINAPAKLNSKALFIKEKIFFKKKPSFISLPKLYEFAKLIFLYIFKILAYIFGILTSREKILNLIASLKNAGSKIKVSLKNSSDWFISLNTKSKIIFSSIFVIILLFSLNTIYAGYKNKQQKQQNNLAQIYQEIDLKQSQVDANLLYNNEDGAKKILEEIKNLISGLTDASQDQASQKAKYLQKNTEQIEKVSHAVKIENPKLLADFKNLNSQAEAENLLLLNNRLYSSDSKQKSIYKIDVSNSLVTAIADTGEKISNLKFAIKDKDSVYYLNNDKILMLSGASDEISNLDFNFSDNRANISALALYNNKFYALDRTKNQIYRFTKSQDALSGEENWLSDQADLSQAISLDIDGSIYALNKNGEVLKFSKGKKVDFSLEATLPELAQANKIIVSPDLNFIYILDQANRRLAIFDKAGKFLTQYKSDQFANLKDFSIDEPNKEIYFLNDNSVYQIDASHLK